MAEIRNARDLTFALGGRWHNTIGVASCPVPGHGKGHGDRSPSLSVAEAPDGKVLVCCHAGCTQEDIIHALKVRGLWSVNGERHKPQYEKQKSLWTPILPVPSDAPKPPTVHYSLGNPSAKWTYHDTEGRELGYAVRFDKLDGGKDVLPLTFCRGSNGKKEWRWKALPEPRPLYGLGRLAARPDAPVMICESEKSCDAAEQICPEFVAVTSPGGCRAADKTDWSPLKDRTVIIWPDADEPGGKYATAVARLCREGDAKEIRIIIPPKDENEGWDAANAVDEPWWGNEEIKGLVDTAQPPKDDNPTRLKTVTAHEFLAHKFPPRENLLAPWLPSQGLAQLYASRGAGKTYMAINIAYAVASGGPFLKWEAPKPRKTLYVDGEMPGVVMQERLAGLVTGAAVEPPSPEFLKILTPDLQDMGLPDISTPEGQEIYEPHLDGIEFLVLDNLSCLCRSGRENEAESWTDIQAWLLSLRRRGTSVLFLHHAGKGGQQRGTSRREDVLDTVICLKRPSDYQPSEGCRVEIHFEKARGLYGDDVRPFEAKLETRDGTALWTTRDLDDAHLEKVVELHGLELTQREIAQELDIGLATVNRRLKEAREMGLIK